MKRATSDARPVGAGRGHFNPRPREEGDVSAKFNAKRNVISIHALVKRATGGGTIPPPVIIISIHALVKRAT